MHLLHWKATQRKLQESAATLQSAIEKMNQLSAAVDAYNRKIDAHNKEVSEKFSSAKSALDDIDKKATSQANEKDFRSEGLS